MVIYLEDYIRRHRTRGAAFLVTPTLATAGASLARPNRFALPAARALAPFVLAVAPESIDLPAGCELSTVYAEATLV